METRTIVSSFLLLAGVLGILVWAATRPAQPEEPSINFTEAGVVRQSAPSTYGTDALYLVYEKPGAPALTTPLLFDEQSLCVFGAEEIQCMALSTPLLTIAQDKRVFIEGITTSGSVLVRTFALDTQADRMFGIVRAVTENGEHALVEIDEVEFLSGELAVQAVMNDFNCTREKVADCAPSMNNDFYIRNVSTATKTFSLTKDSSITIFKNPGSPELMTADLATFIEQSKDPSSLITSLPVTFLLNSATITSIEQQYTP